MLISGVGVTAPLYASQVFSTISGDRKGYVTCLHFMVLVVVIGHSLKGMRVGKVKVAEKRATIEVPVKNTDSTLKTGGKSAVEKQTSMSLLRKNAAVAAKK